MSFLTTGLIKKAKFKERDQGSKKGREERNIIIFVIVSVTYRESVLFVVISH